MSRHWHSVVCDRREGVCDSATGIPGAKRNSVAAISVAAISLPAASIADCRTLTDRHHSSAADSSSGARRNNSDDATNSNNATHGTSHADQCAAANPHTAHRAAIHAGCGHHASNADSAGRSGMRTRSVSPYQWRGAAARAAVDLFRNPDRWRWQRPCIRRLCAAIDPRRGAGWNV